MQHNMGKADRVIRGFVLAPAGVIVAALAGLGTVLGIVALIAAAIMLVTALAGWCPLYGLLGVSTCPASTTSDRS
ncbi:MAG: DUF2892 domain-containing protein [Acidimicrobiia bacterium]